MGAPEFENQSSVIILHKIDLARRLAMITRMNSYTGTVCDDQICVAYLFKAKPRTRMPLMVSEYVLNENDGKSKQFATFHNKTFRTCSFKTQNPFHTTSISWNLSAPVWARRGNSSIRWMPGSCQTPVVDLIRLKNNIKSDVGRTVAWRIKSRKVASFVSLGDTRSRQRKWSKQALLITCRWLDFSLVNQIHVCGWIINKFRTSMDGWDPKAWGKPLDVA